MAKTLEDIRFVVEREVGILENAIIINWCNDANMDFGTVLNVPAPTHPITLTTTDLEYALPSDLKEINRLWLQSDFESGINRDLRTNYRIYNGKMQFSVPFPSIDTLNVDYYKYLTFFDAMSDVIDFEDRYMTVYTAYCAMRYFMLRSTQEALGESVAQLNYERAAGSYQMAKNQVIQNYSFKNPDLTIKERW
jgi:hypothetical protein